MNPRAFTLLMPAILISGMVVACAPFLVGPSDPNSSLVIGRIVVDNKYPGGLSGLLPLGVLDKALDVEVETRDGKQYFKVTTEDQGYFFIPNLPPNSYHLLSVIVEGRRSDGSRERYAPRLRRPTFTPVPGKIAYIGTLYIDLSDRGESKIREVREDDRAKTYFQQKYAASPWSTREFVSVGVGAVAATEVATAKASPVEVKAVGQPGTRAEKPEWKVGHEWTYAWTRPGRSGKYVSEIVREENFEGIPSYVIRNEKNEDFYPKEALGLIARKTAGRLVFKRSSPAAFYSWPLEVGKESTISYLRENIQEKSSQNFTYRTVVTKIEQVTVPAGTFETFKVEVYIPRTGNLFAEYWYAPKVKRAVKEREFLDDGLRETELISYKAD